MRKSIVVTTLLILIAPAGLVMAQGSGSSRVQAQGSGSSRAAPPSSGSSRTNSAVPTTPRPPTVTEFAASFWSYLNSPQTPYQRWGTPGKTGQQGEAGGPANRFHREVGQTYVNSTANNALRQLPLGSVLVREAYGADGQTLENITVMYRSKVADPKNGQWYWIMYQPDGSLARTPPDQGNREMAGRIESCAECHRQAEGNDYVFLNDRPAPGSSPNTGQGSGSRR